MWILIRAINNQFFKNKTDGKDQTTHLARNAPGLPTRRQDPKGLMVAYQYDKALRRANQ
ncbi:YD repeat-containing protein [Pseudomonas amygdali pv. sesami]|nr:YD repeat-containing protein [Pseudomonas amygdali pv. sesami]